MIRIQGKIPRKIAIAFSGGIDSVAVLDFLSRKHQVTLLYVNHGDKIAEEESAFVHDIASNYNVNLLTYYANPIIASNTSKEGHWRNERYAFFHEYEGEVITCHHLDDCVETWIWNMCNGRPATIPYRKGNVIRPFRLTSKSDFTEWAVRHDLKWFQDPTNADSDYATRNYIRNELMSGIMKVNPGIHTTIRNKLLEEKI